MKKPNKLEVISFVSGFALLAFELVAARVLAPSIGSSTYVWTSVIGIIIAALSLGYWVGGRIADLRSRPTDLAWLLMVTTVTVLLTQLLYLSTLDSVVSFIGDPRLQAVIASTILFAPTSFLLGALGPYLAKLNVVSLKTSGSQVASLSALNSVGGIAGTFVTGFFLFGYVGSRETFSIIIVLLLLTSWIVVPSYRTMQRAVLSVVVLLVTFLPSSTVEGIVNIDTPSSHYQVIDFSYNDQLVRGLTTGPRGIQSAVYASGSSQPVFWYAQEISRLALQQEPESLLILGGGAFTLPQYLAEQLPESQIDVVEIDPALEDISAQYFNYKAPANVRPVFQDARSYVNQTSKQYDVIIVDVYGDTSIPFSLITKQYGESIERAVAPGGRVIVNIIAGDVGPCKEVLGAVDAAYRQKLPYGAYSTQPGAAKDRANYIVSYAREATSDTVQVQLPRLKRQPYTDNFSPAERLYYDCQSSN